MSKYSIHSTPFEIQMELAHKIRLIRKGTKTSQKELAERAGVSLGSLKRFENSGKISLESFLKLLNVLNRLDEMKNILNPVPDDKNIEELFSNKMRNT